MFSIEVWTAPAALAGAHAIWSVPALAAALPSRSLEDRQRLRVWSPTQRAGLAVAGVIVVGSALLRSTHAIHVVVAAVLGAVLLTSAAVDLRTNRLPDRLTGLALVVVGATTWLLAISEGADVLVRVGIGTAVFAGVLEAVHRLQPAGMGRGDVKLAAVLGALLGVVAPSGADTVRLVVVALMGAMVVTLAVTALVGAVRRSVFAAVPFGPGLAAATWIVATTTTTHA